MSLDRTLCPESKNIEKLDIIQAKKSILDNNIPLFSINAGTQDIVRLELCFSGGIYHQNKTLVANAVSSQLKEGTKSKSGKELFENLDYYGAFLETHTDNRSSRVIAYSLNKHLDKILPLIKEVLESSIFPEKELKTYLTNLQQKHMVNMEKVSFMARQKFLDVLFGQDHPYGKMLTPSSFENVEKEDILKFFNEFYVSNNCFIVCSGSINNETNKLINQYFGSDFLKVGSPNLDRNYQISQNPQKRHVVKKNDVLQACVRLGKHAIGKSHEDYFGLKVLNTILGGYFGSRLMSKIREDKGYTYSIGSALVSGKDTGYFLIQTEVKNDVADDTINEIYKELKKLREEPVGLEELNTVKSYMLGNFLRESDGPFSLATQFSNLHQNNFSYDHLNKFTETIKKIDPIKIKELANKYLGESDFYEIIAGNV